MCMKQDNNGVYIYMKQEAKKDDEEAVYMVET